MLFTKEILKNYADKINLVLSDDAFDVLSNELEYRTRELIQEAYKLMFFSRRNKLSVDDINNAFRIQDYPPLFGYSKNEDLVFKETQSSFYIPDEEIDLTELINAPLPKYTPPSVLSTHWLLIDGVQPQIPENLNDKEEVLMKKSKLTDYQIEAQLKSQHQHYLTKELKFCFDNIINNIQGNDDACRLEAEESLRSEKGIQQLIPYFITYFNENILTDVKNSEKYLLMYNYLFENKNIRLDSSLHEIIPIYLTVLLSDELNAGVRRVAMAGLKYLFNKFKHAYSSLGPRIINTLLKHATAKKSTTSTQKIAIESIMELTENDFELLEKNMKNFSDEIKNYAIQKYK